MFTENGLMVDLERVHKAVAESDVFTIGFLAFAERLLVDTRTLGEGCGPMVTLVDPVETVEERFFWLGQRRPQLGPPEKFTFFVWPHSLRLLESHGVVDELRSCCKIEMWPDMSRQIDDLLGELRKLESQAVRNAVTGDSFHTVWSAHR